MDSTTAINLSVIASVAIYDVMASFVAAVAYFASYALVKAMRHAEALEMGIDD